jgi:hypothetical protein
VRYVITNAQARAKSRRVHAEGIEPLPAYDVAEYIKLLKAAADEVLSPFEECQSRDNTDCFA